MQSSKTIKATFKNREEYLASCLKDLSDCFDDCQILNTRRKFYSEYELVVTPVFPTVGGWHACLVQVLFESQYKGTALSRCFVVIDQYSKGVFRHKIIDALGRFPLMKLPKEVRAEIMKMTL